ncbi:hypothetical protein [Aliiroseovarius halocynthiae]|uniref:Uncharacterized protein n=1 Tax=Aliiroseovarius halocynthiae TaxID=985055 RepID=A0A545SU88_9RHOB|nr:hypothetical protein [Aliiroseovarius halocynthiae]TQV68532.1 hypothetical protein FIL88_02805 [Aliiroseovarius halocynthiae]
MDVIILFLLGVPVFVALSLIPHAKLGIVAGIGAAVLLCVLWIGEPMITSNDPAGNAMAMGFQAFAYVSAAGGGGSPRSII